MPNKIIVDAFGGDNAPLVNLMGAEAAVQEYGVSIVLVGDEEKIRACAAENTVSLEGMTIVHTPDIFDMHDDPSLIVKSKRKTSMGVGMDLLAADGGDAFVSAGSTGALVVGSTFLVKRIRGIKRPALGTVIPMPQKPGKKTLLMDCGANVDCRAEMLENFAVMGAKYMELSEGVENPRVGLLNVGTENTKGDLLRLETYKLLESSGLNFIGNVEAREIMSDACDVLVTDGFSGNIVLKLTEGVGMTFYGMIKQAFLANRRSKLAALILKKNLRGMKSLMDYSEHGGAPMLGARKPVIKAHGSSNALAIKNAIRQANTFASSGTIGAIESFYENRVNNQND